MRVQVVNERCQQVAQRLLDLRIPNPVEPWSLSSNEVDYDLSTLNLVLVAICHQTQRLGGEIDGVHRRGWDYLQVRFQEWAAENALRISPANLASLSPDELRQLLNCGEQLSEVDVARRAALIRDCGDGLLRKGVATFTNIYEQCGHRIATGTINLVTTLGADFRAFNDPVRKKSMFLLGLNSATCGWVYEDQESLNPPVDYHEVRGHLRLGTVRLVDEPLRQLVEQADSVDEAADVEIRNAVTAAIRRVSELSGFTTMQLHYAFWNLFRSVCLRGRPRCRGQIRELLPISYKHLVAGDTCCFVDCCDSAEMHQAIDEHRFDTEWY